MAKRGQISTGLPILKRTAERFIASSDRRLGEGKFSLRGKMNDELGYVVYLDWNVIADLESGKLPKLEKKLFDLKNKNAISIPFSSTHIKEACNIESREEINKRLAYISKLSSSLYFVNNLQSTGYRIETPKSVYDTISEVDLGFDTDKFISNLIPYEALKYARNLLTLDPARLNNILPEEAIDEIDKIITSKEIKDRYWPDYEGDLSFRGLIKKTSEIVEQEALPLIFKDLYCQNKYIELQNIIIMAFSLLDSLGFWPDKKEAYERASRFADSMHAFNGAFANLVISADRRFCMKSKAVYSLLKRRPTVLHVKLDKDEIMKILDRLIDSS